jgi:hypothetical protein
MTGEDAQLIFETLEYNGAEGLEEDGARSDYSGRGMFGRTTYAVVADKWDIERALEDLGLDIEDYRIDSMALRVVLY